MSDEESKKQTEETEILTAADEKLCRMLGDLKRCRAPQDFAFHLKARIARTRPEELRSNALWPALRYALPFSAVLLLTVFVAFNFAPTTSNLSGQLALENAQSAPVQANASSTETAPSANSFISSAAASENNEEAEQQIAANLSIRRKPQKPNENAQLIVAVNNTKTIPAQRKLNDGNDFGGVRESTSKDSPVLLPAGIGSPQSNVRPDDFATKSEISVREILSQIGAEADFANAVWKVKSVRENTPAQRAGVLSGDVIEAIDNLKLSSETISAQTFSAKVLHVSRDGKKLALGLK